MVSNQICDGNRRHYRFIRDLLQSLEVVLYLNMRLCWSGEKKNG